MMIRILLFAIFASWLAACESSGDGASTSDPNGKTPDEFNLSDAWANDRDSLPELGGYTDLRPNSVIDPQAIKNYVLEPVMQMNRRMGQAIYNSPILNRLAQEIESGDAARAAKDLYEDLFKNVNTGNQVRYQKQLKCLADIHEIELGMQSLLAAAHDPALREGVFNATALEILEAKKDEEERITYLLEELWQMEDGKSDLTNMWQQYRNKVAAFLVLPFGDEQVYSNTWACSLKSDSWEQFESGPSFVVDVRDAWEGWQNADKFITKENVSAQLKALIELVQDATGATDLNSLDLGLMNRVVFENALKEEPEDNDGSHEGSLYRMAKLVCKGFWGAEDTEALCAEGDKSFVGTYQITRDVSEQIASNASNALRWIAYDGGLARELYKKYNGDRNARALVNAILELKEKRLDPLPQRAFYTQQEGGGKAGGCDATGLCERSLLISMVDANNEELAINEKKPGINSGEGNTAFPIDAGNKNVLRHDRVQYVMDQVDDGIEDYLTNVDEAVEELLGAWNHLITLLLITFGWLRLRSRRLA